jgi:hypothetical protein
LCCQSRQRSGLGPLQKTNLLNFLIMELPRFLGLWKTWISQETLVPRKMMPLSLVR